MKIERIKSLTNQAKQFDVVLLAVYILGGVTKSIDTEDVAVKCDELAPGLFSWQKYPKQINLELVRVNLSNAKKKQYGELLRGSGREGWRFSLKGLEWMESRGLKLLDSELKWDSENRTAGSIDILRRRREKDRLLSSTAWKKFIEGKPLTLRDARALFRIDEYSTGKMLEIKIVRIQSLFKEDQQVSSFLTHAGKLILENEGQDECTNGA